VSSRILQRECGAGSVQEAVSMGVVAIGADTVGLIVRGKNNDGHSPGLLEQHADCILSTSEPYGYFGGEGDASSGSSGPASDSASGSSAGGPSAISNSVGMNMKGMVADYDAFLRIRPPYVKLSLAKKYKVVSSVLLVKVTPAQASLFDKFWRNLALTPGSFSLLGDNCSTHVSEAFVSAGIVSTGIPGLDTPNNLYIQIKAKLPGKTTTHSGYIGFEKRAGTKDYDLHVEPAP